MPISSATIFTALSPVISWVVGKAMDGLVGGPIKKRWAGLRIKRKVQNIFNFTVVETQKQYWSISWFDVIENLNPVLQNEIEKLFTVGEDADALAIGEVLCQNAKGPLDPQVVGAFFIDRMELNLLDMPELNSILTLRHSFKARRAVEHALEGFALPLQPTGLVSLPPHEERIVEEALARSAPGLLEWPQVLPDGMWIDRPELDNLISTINEAAHSTTILLGPPGSGKSALLSRLGNNFQGDTGTNIVAIKADQVSATVKTDQDLGIALGLDGPATEVIRRLSASNKVLLLVDQMDAVADLADLHTGRLNALINIITSLSGIENVHIVASARTFEFNHDPRFARIEAQEITLTLPGLDIVTPILNAHGVQTQPWGPERLNMMRTPQTLSTFLVLAEELGGAGHVAETYQGMLDQVWNTRLADPELSVFVSRVALLMAEREELSLPISMFDADADKLRASMLAGVFLQEADRPSFQFSHQTLFDHAVARSFVARNVSLLEFVARHQDSLTPRPRIWSVLTYLREASPTTYQNETQAVWRTRSLRYHLKCLLIDFLGSRENPQPFEQRIMLEAFETDDLITRAAHAIAGNSGWFSFARIHVLQSMMGKTDNQLDLAILILLKALPFARDDVLTLMQENWRDARQLRMSANVLRHLEDWNDTAIRLTEPLANDAELSNWHICELASVIGASNPEQGAQFVINALRAKTEQLIQDAQETGVSKSSKIEEFLDNRAGSGWYELSAIPQAEPVHFLREAAPWFLEITEICTRPGHWYPGRYRDGAYIGHFSDAEDRLHDSDVVAAMQAALDGTANTDFSTFLELTQDWRASDILLLHRMIARAMVQTGNNRVNSINDYLFEDNRRLYLGERFETSHLETKRLISTVGASGNREEIDRLFSHIIDWTPERTDWDNESAEHLHHWRRTVQCTRLQLLTALPTSVLLENQRLALEELKRACPDFEEQADSSGLRMASWVGTPMSHEQMERAADGEILNILMAYPDNHERSFGGPSSLELSRSFAEFAKNHPQRAMAIARQLPVNQHEEPARYILGPIAGSDDISFDEFFSFAREQIDRGFSSSEFMADLADAARSAAEKPHGIPDEFLELFTAQLLDASTEDTGEENQDQDASRRDQSILWGFKGSVAVPHGNYRHLSTIWWGYILREPTQGGEALDVILEHLERNEDPKVWKHLAMFDLKFLHLCPQEKSAALIYSLFERFPQVLGSASGTMLAARSCHWAEEADYHAWCESIRASNWPLGKQAYGELLTLRSVIKPDEQWCRIGIDEALSDLEDGQNGERLGIASASVNLWREPPYRNMVTPDLIRLTSCSSPAVQKAIIDVFRLTSGNMAADQNTRQLLSALHNQGIFGPGSEISFVASALTDLVFLLPDEVYAVARDIIDAIPNDMNQHTGERMLDANELNHVAINLTRLGEEYRQRGIELFESLLRAQAYGTDDLLSEIDGVRLNASTRPIRRLRRRRPNRR